MTTETAKTQPFRETAAYDQGAAAFDAVYDLDQPVAESWLAGAIDAGFRRGIDLLRESERANLLAACKSAVEFFEKTIYKQSAEVSSPAYRFDEKSFEPIGVVSLDINAIRAAIAKAESTR